MITDPDSRMHFFILWSEVQEQAQKQQESLYSLAQKLYGHTEVDCDELKEMIHQFNSLNYRTLAIDFYQRLVMSCIQTFNPETQADLRLLLLQLQQVTEAVQVFSSLSSEQEIYFQRIARLWQFALRGKSSLLTQR